MIEASLFVVCKNMQDSIHEHNVLILIPTWKLYFIHNTDIRNNLLKWSEVAKSCPTLCHPMDCSLQGSSVHGIFQASILEWVTISSPGDLPDPGIEPGSPALQADTLLSEPEIIFFLDLLRCYWHVSLCKFKVQKTKVLIHLYTVKALPQ